MTESIQRHQPACQLASWLAPSLSLSHCSSVCEPGLLSAELGWAAGIMVGTETVAEAFDAMYYLEQAARITVKALSARQKLRIVDDKVYAFAALPSGSDNLHGAGNVQMHLDQAATSMLYM